MNKALNKMLHELFPGKEKFLKKVLAGKVKMYNEMREDSRLRAIQSLLAAIQRFVDEYVALYGDISCKKGCSHCCHLNVQLSEDEALLIAEYCKESHIPIDRSYLLMQLSVSKEEIWKYPFSACVFLKDGLCSIYEVRPSACRCFMVVSPPQYCDTKKESPFQPVFSIAAKAELLNYVIMEAAGKMDRLPALLLPYSQLPNTTP